MAEALTGFLLLTQAVSAAVLEASIGGDCSQPWNLADVSSAVPLASIPDEACPVLREDDTLPDFCPATLQACFLETEFDAFRHSSRKQCAPVDFGCHLLVQIVPKGIWTVGRGTGSMAEALTGFLLLTQAVSAAVLEASIGGDCSQPWILADVSSAVPLASIPDEVCPVLRVDDTLPDFCPATLQACFLETEFDAFRHSSRKQCAPGDFGCHLLVQIVPKGIWTVGRGTGSTAEALTGFLLLTQAVSAAVLEASIGGDCSQPWNLADVSSAVPLASIPDEACPVLREDDTLPDFCPATLQACFLETEFDAFRHSSRKQCAPGDFGCHLLVIYHPHSVKYGSFSQLGAVE
ncbi:hypothetical protein MTO96_019625 [Rhipicephalus appendiculatus]